MKYFSLYQLNKSVKKLIEGIGKNFWITAEIANIQIRTHGYLELVQKEEQQIIAKSRAIIWWNTLEQLQQKFGKDLDFLLKIGSKILIQVKVTYHEVHGISLVVSDIDPNYTLGELEKKRLETIKILSENGLMEVQKELQLPLVVQKLAVISTPSAAGYKDFKNHLAQNEYGFSFQISLFEATMQGIKSENEIITQINAIFSHKEKFDAILIIRGGGSKLDLEVFNSYQLALKIVESPLPVITGIGHHQDISVADMVANTSLKTPTAVADFLISKASNFEIEITMLFQNIATESNLIIQKQKENLKELQYTIQKEVSQRINFEKIMLSNQQSVFKNNINHFLKMEKLTLENIGKQLKILAPENVLARGYSIIYKDKKAITSVTGLKNKDQIIIKMKDGEVESSVTKL